MSTGFILCPYRLQKYAFYDDAQRKAYQKNIKKRELGEWQ